MQVVKILVQRMNVADDKFKTLENFILEEIENIRKEFDGLQHGEFKMKEAITSLAFRLMNTLRTIDTLKDKVKTLKEGVEVGGSTSLNHYREDMVDNLRDPY